jgi:acylphosphatase
MERGETEEVQLRALVRGLVQGVNFRTFVVTSARTHGLRDNVRNLPDSRTVEVNAHGSREGLEQLVRDLWVGPPGGRAGG